MKTGTVNCECGGQIISNSGKVMARDIHTIACWECGKIYDHSSVEKVREEGKEVVFKSAKMKVYQLNECDWWMDISLKDAIKNYCETVGIPEDEAIDEPGEVSEEMLEKLKFRPDLDEDLPKCTFKQELERLNSIGNGPMFFASTEC